MNLKTIIQFLAVLFTALSAGLFYGWVVSVIPGTKKTPDQAYVETMQSINKEILNPAFIIIFFGALFLLIVSTYFQYKVKVDSVFYLMLAATLIYTIGTIGVTMIGNVPLNNTLEALDLSTFTEQDFSNARDAFESSWNNFNMIRTISALAAFVLILLALLKK